MLDVGVWAVALSVIAANIVAVAFTLNQLRWIKVHQARAKAVLRFTLPHLADMQTLSNKQWYVREDSGDNSPRFTSSMALLLFHWLMVLAALVVGVAASSS